MALEPDMEVAFYRGSKLDPKKLITKISGNSIDHKGKIGEFAAIFKYRFSMLNIGSSKAYKKLDKALKKKGKSRTIGKKKYSKALDILVVVKGRLTEASGLTTLSAKTTLVNTGK